MSNGLRSASIVVLAVLACWGCGRSSQEIPDGERVVVDDLGREVRFDGVPARIISLAPSFTETLYALGADSLLVGVTSYCNYPSTASEKAVIGDLLAPDIEGIIALKPDLVLISVEGNSQQTFTRLRDMGVRLFVSNPRDLEGVLKSIGDIASITGCEKAGAKLLGRLRAVRDSVRANPPERAASAMMLLSLQPLIAAGGGTFIGEMIDCAGGRNAASDLAGGYPVLGREELLLRNPDVLLLPDDLGVDGKSLLQRFPEWRNLSALRSGRLYTLNADVLMRPGPRLFDALREVHKLLCMEPTRKN